MQLCESCGACRENNWKICPFCRAELNVVDTKQPNSSQHFDALAAEAETSDMALLPSPVLQDEEPEEDTDLITAQDLAHLTGDGRPASESWNSPSPAATTPAPASDTGDGIDAPVSKLLVFPLIAVALAAVAFVAYNIVAGATSPRPGAVALVDQPTTTFATTTTTLATTTTQPPAVERTIGAIGIDLAEQASALCAGKQFGIARAGNPSLAVFNDLVLAAQEGRGDWGADDNQITLRSPVPPLVGCLRTADGGEIDRCPTDGNIVSRRSVAWSYRVLRTIDGTELGADSGFAEDVRPCEELVAEANGEDLPSWSELPQDRLDQVAAAYTSAPHPQSACPASSLASDEDDQLNAEAVEPGGVPQDLSSGGLAVHAAFAGTTDVDLTLPAGWMASDDRPVQAVLCLSRLTSDEPEAAPTPVEDAPDTSNAETEAAADTTSLCAGIVRVHAITREGIELGSWDYTVSTCLETAEALTPPDEWWLNVVGPDLGYPVVVDDSPDEAVDSSGE